MSSPSVTRSKCRTCGEKLMQTGNFQIKIVKAKPIPKKMRKFMKDGKLDDNKKDVLKQTKFGQFLLKRAEPANSVEITCGQCSSSCKICTKKPNEIKRNLSPALRNSLPPSISTSPFSSSNRRKKKRNREVNAGLFIPTSEDKNDNSSPAASAYEFNSSTTPKTNNLPSSSKPTMSKEKEMDNLRKVLFKSNRKKGACPGQGTPSLKDFLSSM